MTPRRGLTEGTSRSSTRSNWATTASIRATIAASRDDDSPFPWADISLSGEVETLTSENPALAAEDLYRARLRENRGRDAAAGRALIGPHVADLLAFHGPKGAPAAQSSTGEQ